MHEINNLIKQVSGYLPPEQVEKIEQAYTFGEKAHEGQQRISGEPYIYHPLEVAIILAHMHMDFQTLIAALLQFLL